MHSNINDLAKATLHFLSASISLPPTPRRRAFRIDCRRNGKPIEAYTHTRTHANIMRVEQYANGFVYFLPIAAILFTIFVAFTYIMYDQAHTSAGIPKIKPIQIQSFHRDYLTISLIPWHLILSLFSFIFFIFCSHRSRKVELRTGTRLATIHSETIQIAIDARHWTRLYRGWRTTFTIEWNRFH